MADVNGDSLDDVFIAVAQVSFWPVCSSSRKRQLRLVVSRPPSGKRQGVRGLGRHLLRCQRRRKPTCTASGDISSPPLLVTADRLYTPGRRQVCERYSRRFPAMLTSTQAVAGRGFQRRWPPGSIRRRPVTPENPISQRELHAFAMTGARFTDVTPRKSRPSSFVPAE